MPIDQVTIQNIRVYESAEFCPHPKLNIITGGNGSGKTTILESLSVLTTSKSFRCGNLGQVIRKGEESLHVRSNITSDAYGGGLKMSVHVHGSNRSYVIDDRPVRLVELAAIQPSLVISPDSHNQFKNQAQDRRSILDWMLFHVKPSFYSTWASFQRALEQRNILLRTATGNALTKSLVAWNIEFMRASEEISSAREEIVDAMSPLFERFASMLLQPETKYSLGYSCGWDKKNDLMTILGRDFDRDRTRGFTHSGPHRADLQLLVSGRPARHESSHGQLKLLTLAVRLAQVQLLKQETNKDCCLLIDDLAAELDLKHRQQAFDAIAELQSQVFITSSNMQDLDLERWPDHATFHVEHGQIINKKTITKQYIN